MDLQGKARYLGRRVSRQERRRLLAAFRGAFRRVLRRDRRRPIRARAPEASRRPIPPRYTVGEALASEKIRKSIADRAKE